MWNRGRAAVLTAGTLALAVSAVVALWPDPDPVDSARFTTVSVFAPVSLGEYRERTLSIVPLGAGPLSGRPADVVLAAATAEPRPAPSPSRVHRSSTSPSGRVTPLSPAPTRSTSPTDSPSPTTTLSAPPADRPAASIRRTAADVLSRVRELAPEYVLPTTTRPPAAAPTPPSPGATPSPGPPPLPRTVAAMLTAAATDENGEPLPPDVAAERVIELLGETRTVETGEGKQNPLGVLVDVNVELEGLRGRPVLLTWSIFPHDGGPPLFGSWLQTVAAYRLEAGSNRDTASFDLWLPLPKDPGPYVAGLQLSVGDIRIASVRTDPFG